MAMINGCTNSGVGVNVAAGGRVGRGVGVARLKMSVAPQPDVNRTKNRMERKICNRSIRKKHSK